MNLSYGFAIFLGVLLFTSVAAIRAIKLRAQKLQANCLLTAYPIVIVEPKVTFLSNLKRWFSLAFLSGDDPYTYLSAHGYTVLKMSAQQLMQHQQLLMESHNGVHLFQTQLEKNWFKSAGLPNDLVKSQTDITAISLEDCLKHAISLAENDFQCSH